jgi:hypothetical protein
MNHLEQLALDAEFAVYVIASPDASEIEFLSLKPRTATESEIQSLAARWPGRDLRSSGVIGRLADGRVQMALKMAFGNIELAALLCAFMDYCETAEPHRIGDSVDFCERLYALQDPRMN